MTNQKSHRNDVIEYVMFNVGNVKILVFGFTNCCTKMLGEDSLCNKILARGMFGYCMTAFF